MVWRRAGPPLSAVPAPDAGVEAGRETYPGGVRREHNRGTTVHRRGTAEQRCVETIEGHDDRQATGWRLPAEERPVPPRVGDEVGGGQEAQPLAVLVPGLLDHPTGAV